LEGFGAAKTSEWTGLAADPAAATRNSAVTGIFTGGKQAELLHA
jgi:hypothetical protein